MQTIPISEIVLGERIRKNFNDDKIAELAESIADKGLYQAPVLQNDGKTLVMGENRIKAIQKLYDESRGPIYHNGQQVPDGCIPFSYLSDMEESSVLEAELEENILRQDLSWQERAEATKRLHDLRVSQYGDYNPGQNEGWSKLDSAKEIHGENRTTNDVRQVRDDLLLAEHLDDPDVQKAKNEKEARKVIERKAKEKERQERAQRVEAEGKNHSLHLADAQELISTWEDGYFDIICTDPPYGIDVHTQQQRDGEYHEYDDTDASLEMATHLLAYEGYRITKPQAHLYMFCDIRKWPDLRAAFWLAGWEVWERPLIWYKGNTGSFGGTDWGPRRTYEAVLYAAKGRRPVTALFHDVLDVPKPTQTEHPAGKPEDVFYDLLRRSANPGDRILDPFAGGGPVFGAAERLHAHATGIELSDKYHSIAATRLQELRNGAELLDLANE